MTDVLIVSLYGRGHWMAWDLADRGLKVQLVDLSESMGRWTPEDWEGPFGFSQGEGLLPSQLARLQEEDDLDSVHDGFTLWTPSGPVDTRGPLSQHFQNGILNKNAFESQARDFKIIWPGLLSRSLSSNVYFEHFSALDSPSHLDMFQPFFVHRVTRRGLQKSLDWCKQKGVEVFQSASLRDIQTEGSQISGVEISSEFKGVLQAQQYVWCLTSAETKKVESKAAKTLYPSGILEMEWSWIRYRFSFDADIYQKVIPTHAVMIDDLNVPWTHNNLLILQKTVKPQHCDLWMRLPTHHRFQRAYLEDMGAKAKELLLRRLPTDKIEILEMPQDYLYDFEELGPSLFPVYNRTAKEKFEPRNFKNVFYDGPEHWLGLDWMNRFRYQSQLTDKLKAWKQKQIELEQKRKPDSDRSLHAP